MDCPPQILSIHTFPRQHPQRKRAPWDLEMPRSVPFTASREVLNDILKLI